MAKMTQANWDKVKLSRQRAAEREEAAHNAGVEPENKAVSEPEAHPEPEDLFSKKKRKRKWKLNEDVENRETKPLTDLETK
jgi:hypothetical protein